MLLFLFVILLVRCLIYLSVEINKQLLRQHLQNNNIAGIYIYIYTYYPCTLMIELQYLQYHLFIIL